MASRLFDFIDQRHEGPWGSVLDAGTGIHSATWLAERPTRALTLVTGSARHAAQVRRSMPGLRPADRLLIGNWANPDLLAGETFDVVLADYLVGAIEGFAPYFQEALFGRLAQLTGRRLYLVGLDPYVTAEPKDPAARLIWEIGRYRDACLLLAGEQPYREYPAEWALEQLDRAGLEAIEARRFPIRYKARFVNGQINMALMRLPRIADPVLAEALKAHGEALRRRALDAAADLGGLRCGHDYVIVAEPRRPGTRAGT